MSPNAKQDVSLIKKLIEDRGFIFTDTMMIYPVGLGCKDTDNTIDLSSKFIDFDNNVTVSIEATTLHIHYQDTDGYTVSHQIFQNGPTESIKRFSLYALIYQNVPGIDDELNLTGCRGAFW